jgi:hypothetical protein
MGVQVVGEGENNQLKNRLNELDDPDKLGEIR